MSHVRAGAAFFLEALHDHTTWSIQMEWNIKACACPNLVLFPLSTSLHKHLLEHVLGIDAGWSPKSTLYALPGAVALCWLSMSLPVALSE